MNARVLGLAAVVLVGLSAGRAAPSLAAEPVDYDMINRIMDEGTQRSQVMDTLRALTDDIGPRLTGSPQMRRANDWTLEQFAAWGLRNGHLEGFEFGRGWTWSKSLVRMRAPRLEQLEAYPLSWTPGTEGAMAAPVILAPMDSRDDLAKYEGKLKGKIVLISKPAEQQEPRNSVFRRHDADSLAALSEYDLPAPPDGKISDFGKAIAFERELYTFLADEGAVAAVKNNWRDGGLLQAQLYLHRVGDTPRIPAISLAQEDYQRIVRFLERKIDVELELDIDTTFYDEDTKAYNSVAEIPGRGGNPEIVMAGAHLDSWYIGDGAVDNGAGSAVVMEAARILAALGVKPKRTIRFALWSGEEQGLYGSLDYVERHLASRPEASDPKNAGVPRFDVLDQLWPMTLKRDHAKFAAYFNLDNGSGRIRGIYGEGNAATQPIFEAWLAPFHEMGAETVIMRSTGGTDHLSFQAAGLPAYQFIQDPLDYGSRLHHTQVDTFDHAWEKDLKQASIILASFLYHAAMRDEMLPRKPLPQEPVAVKRAREQDEESAESM